MGSPALLDAPALGRGTHGVDDVVRDVGWREAVEVYDPFLMGRDDRVAGLGVLKAKDIVGCALEVMR